MLSVQPFQKKIFSGSSHQLLSQEITSQLGLPLSAMHLGKFPDGEIQIQVLEEVKGCDVFVVQSVVRDPHFTLMELLIIIDALKRAAARQVTAVIPYFGYCRQDRMDKPGVPITAKLVANLLVQAGATRLITVDLHAGQLQGFFDIPVEHLHGKEPLLEKIQEQQLNSCVVVAPDIGSVKLAKAYAKHLKTDFAVMSKERLSATEVSEVTLIGDVTGRDVLLADDMCSTGATLVSAAKACQEKGAKRIFGAVTHGLFVDGAIERIENSPLEALWVTNTIPVTDQWAKSPKLITVSIAPLLACALREAT
jgi:ribose-phosphate pyrophosphokinase